MKKASVIALLVTFTSITSVLAQQDVKKAKPNSAFSFGDQPDIPKTSRFSKFGDSNLQSNQLGVSPFTSSQPPTFGGNGKLPPAGTFASNQKQSLQSRFVSLANQLAQTMEEKELHDEIDQMENRLKEKNAQMSLNSVNANLSSIIKNFPDSAAAKNAKLMLDAVKVFETKTEERAE